MDVVGVILVLKIKNQKLKIKTVVLKDTGVGKVTYWIGYKTRNWLYREQWYWHHLFVQWHSWVISKVKTSENL